MYNKTLILVYLTLCVSLGSLNSVPPITKCKSEDFKCITASAQELIPLFGKGFPDMKIEGLDPLKFALIDASTSNLQLKVTDGVVTGLSNCQALKIWRDAAKSKIYLQVECTGELNGQYEMNGKLFILPIEGKGKLYAKLKKCIINVEVDMGEKVGKDGKKYWVVKTWKHTYELKDKCELRFDNLFPTNELLSKTTSDFISSNGNDIVMEISPPVIQYLLAKVVDSVKRFVSKIPYEHLTLD